MDLEREVPSANCFNNDLGAVNSFYQSLTFVFNPNARRQAKTQNQFSFKPLFVEQS